MKLTHYGAYYDGGKIYFFENKKKIAFGYKNMITIIDYKLDSVVSFNFGNRFMPGLFVGLGDDGGGKGAVSRGIANHDGEFSPALDGVLPVACRELSASLGQRRRDFARLR
jgi:hypothetical protein